MSSGLSVPWSPLRHEPLAAHTTSSLILCRSNWIRRRPSQRGRASSNQLKAGPAQNGGRQNLWDFCAGRLEPRHRASPALRLRPSASAPRVRRPADPACTPPPACPGLQLAGGGSWDFSVSVTERATNQATANQSIIRSYIRTSSWYCSSGSS